MRTIHENLGQYQLELELLKTWLDVYHELGSIVRFVSSNIMVQDGLEENHEIVENVRESVGYVNRTDGRLLLFAEIVQQLQLSGKRLIHDFRTRWNSTFEMLSCATKFK